MMSVRLPLGAADAAARCRSRGTAAKKGGEKMTVIAEAPAVAVAAVYSSPWDLRRIPEVGDGLHKSIVVPAEAGIQGHSSKTLDSRLRGNDDINSS
jgi:hypothetical protein